jgi:hypothetical protein
MSTSRATVDNVDYYDCTEKPDGNYIHPTDCSRYITCSSGHAADKACPDCDPANVAGCQDSPYMFYDGATDRCVWPSDTACITAD